MPALLPQPVSTLITAANAGDITAFLAAFTDDGYVDDWGRTFTGSTAIRGWSDGEFLGKQVTLDVTSVTERDGQSVVIATVGGKGFNGPSTFSFTVAGDKVSAMTIRA